MGQMFVEPPPFDGWTVARYVWGLLVTLLGVITMRQVKRIDELERKSATRADVKSRFEALQGSIADAKDEAVRTRQELREDMREHRAESREMLGRIFERLDASSDRK
jgi:hypothetical protein